jgi:hypothetical protein
MLRASQRKASFYRPTIPTNQPEPIQHSSSSPTLPPPAANHFVQETFLIGSAMRKVLSIHRPPLVAVWQRWPRILSDWSKLC